MNRARFQSVPKRACLSACCWLASATASAADDGPPDWLPESAPQTTPQPAALPAGRRFVELVGDYTRRSDSLEARRHGNLGLDGYFTRAFGTRWHGVLSGRFDVDSEPGMGLGTRNLSVTLRESYVTRSAGDWTVDLGRINIRDGVAVVYNPTDVFRSGSLPVRRTQDPARLRESRLGVVGVRLQRHTSAGDFAGLLAPRLHVPANPDWYDPRWGAVNEGRAQLYLRYTPPRWRGVYGNVVWHQAEGGSRTLGLNAINNFGQSVVGYVEYAHTRQPTLPALAQDPAAPRRAFSQLAAGISISNQSRQTFTVEYAHNGGGVGSGDRRGAWQTAAPERLGATFAEAGRRLDPLGRDSLALMVQWDRFLARDADLLCLARVNVSDRSRFGWCEWRYKQPNAEWSINLSGFHGDGRSEFGAARQRWAIGVRARFFF